MSAGFQSQFPETAGLAAANSGFGLVEGAFFLVPRPMKPAAFWLLAVLSCGAVTVAAGITMRADVSPVTSDSGVSPIAVGGPPTDAEAPSSFPPVEASTGANSSEHTVVL